MFEKMPAGCIEKLDFSVYKKGVFHAVHLTRIYRNYDQFSNLRCLHIGGERYSNGRSLMTWHRAI